MNESKPIPLADFLNKCEFEAFKAGKGKLWKAAYDHARRTMGVAASATKANLVVGITADLERPEASLVNEIRIALDARKIAQFTLERS